MIGEKISMPSFVAPDAKAFNETQGFVEKVIEMAKKVTAEVEKSKNAADQTNLARAKALMAQGQWESAMEMFQSMVGGSSPAKKSLSAWAGDVIQKANEPAPDPNGVSLTDWAGTVMAKSSEYAVTIVESFIRDQLYNEGYHNLSDDELAEHAVDQAVIRLVYSSKEAELKAAMREGGRTSLVAIARRNVESARRAAQDRKNQMASANSSPTAW